MAEPVWFLTSVYKYELIVPQINKNIVFIIKNIVFIITLNASHVFVIFYFEGFTSIPTAFNCQWQESKDKILSVFLVSLTSSGLLIVKCSSKLMGTRLLMILQKNIRSFKAIFDMMGSMLSSLSLDRYSRSV